jgi:hypothetical protein
MLASLVAKPMRLPPRSRKVSSTTCSDAAAIALVHDGARRRLPLDSQWLHAVQNPPGVGYGGAWPFLGTAKVGVNVPAPYRGGESAYQPPVSRVCQRRDRHFIAEPQFGGGNREGSSRAPSGSTTGWDSGQWTMRFAALAQRNTSGCATHQATGRPAGAATITRLTSNCG